MSEAERRIHEALALCNFRGSIVSYDAAAFAQACSPHAIRDVLTVRDEREARMLAEIDRLRQWEVAGREWLDKTDWVQSKDAPVQWLGKHRADILRSEIDRLIRERDEAREWNRQMVEKAASGGALDGYRELAARAAAAENERDAMARALLECDAVARARGDKYGLCDSIDNSSSPYPSQWLADLLAKASAALAQIEKERSDA